jgi:hypothetical protein
MLTKIFYYDIILVNKVFSIIYNVVLLQTATGCFYYGLYGPSNSNGWFSISLHCSFTIQTVP